ncbi:MAG: GNAT family N-acetyltransferase [Akkermansiaceae bacterium]
MPERDERIDLELRDGAYVSSRPLGPQDREELARGYRLLSPEARYQRFWVRTGNVISDSTLDRLLDPDRKNHAIWAVMDDTREYPGMGAASYWRSKENPLEAEFSVTVLDRDQKRGIGTLLLALLWRDAYANGIEHFIGYAMPENRKAIDWMLDTGAEGHWDGYQAIFRWNLTDLEGVPSTPAAADLTHWLARLPA